MAEEEPIQGETLATHLRALVDKRLRRMAECRRFRSADDPREALHDLRVASRRLRAFGDVFRDLLGKRAHRKIDRALRRVSNAAGLARDWDVQIALTEGLRDAATVDVDRMGLEYLLDRQNAKRARAARRARRKLGKTDFGWLDSLVRTAFYGGIHSLPEEMSTLSAFARERLERCVAQAEEAGTLMARNGPAGQPEALHQQRIDLKRLRYTLELFQPLLGADYPALSDHTSALQELLGSHHDWVVLAEFVAEQARHLHEKRLPALFSTVSALSRVLAAKHASIATEYARVRFDPDLFRTNIRNALHAASQETIDVRNS